MRTFVIAASIVAVLLGIAFIVSPLIRGLGVTTGFLIGVVLVAVGTGRIIGEVRGLREG